MADAASAREFLYKKRLRHIDLCVRNLFRCFYHLYLFSGSIHFLYGFDLIHYIVLDFIHFFFVIACFLNIAILSVVFNEAAE